MFRAHLGLLATAIVANILAMQAPGGRNLEYEYALYASLITVCLLPIFALVSPLRLIIPNLKHSTHNFRVGVLDYLWVLLIGPIAALLPSIITFATGSCLCSGPGHFFWMTFQWYPAWILAQAGAFGILRGRVAGIHRGRLASASAVILLLSIVLLIWGLWTNPQKRALHLFAGFLHGPIYDDWINLDGNIALGRLAHYFLAVLLLLVAWFRNRTAHISACIVLTGCWFVAAVTANWSPSVALGEGTLKKVLRSRIPGDGFAVHYFTEPKNEKGLKEKPLSTYDEAPLAIKRLYKDAAFHVQDLKAILQEAQLPEVDIYVYPDTDRKKLWFGGGSTDVADVYTPSIHITLGEWPHPTLRHELVHALTSDLAYNGLGFHPNMAFTEGLAVALAPNDRGLSLDESAGSLLTSGRIKNVEDLFSASGFWRESGGRAYVTAGSLIQYIAKNHGMSAVKQLYQGKSWQVAVGEPQAKTIARWEAHVKAAYEESKTAIEAESLFRYPGILRDLCPHSKADLRRSRAESVLVRLRQPIGWDPDADYLSWLLSLDPQDEETRLAMWRREINKFAGERVPDLKKAQGWIETIAGARKWPPKTTEDIEAAIIESDLQRLVGNRPRSVAILEEILTVAAQKKIGDVLLRQAASRLGVEQLIAEPAATEWRRYLATWRKVLPEAQATEPWLATYLRLRRAPEKDTMDKGMLSILAETEPDTALGIAQEAFKREWQQMIVKRFMVAGAYAEAEKTWKNLAETTPEGRRDFLMIERRRATFYAQNPL